MNEKIKELQHKFNNTNVTVLRSIASIGCFSVLVAITYNIGTKSYAVDRIDKDPYITNNLEDAVREYEDRGGVL